MIFSSSEHGDDSGGDLQKVAGLFSSVATLILNSKSVNHSPKGFCGAMEVELVTGGMSEDENYAAEYINVDDYLNLEGERCGICMDVVIDRGVLDCCQHWFCFACIDNWATITSLCPLCQNEFQLITCVPVYDTIGSNKTDEDSCPRDDDWCIEGKNNTLSFPSYYIDENAVVCLDGDDCKIRSGLIAIEEDSDIDTSIACDSCDKWYHAFCVGFDPESTCENSWLCPRCVVDMPQKLDGNSVLRPSNKHDVTSLSGDCSMEASFSGRVSVSVADVGETAVVVSLVEGNPRSQELSVSALEYSKDTENTFLSSCIADMPKLEAPSSNSTCAEPNAGGQELEHSLNTDDEAIRSPRCMNNKSSESGLNLNFGSSVGSSTVGDVIDNKKAEDQVPEYVELKNGSEECLLPVLSADKVMPDNKEVLSVDSSISDARNNVVRISGSKRKHRDSRNAEDGERKVKTEAKFALKKVKADRNRGRNLLKDQADESVLEDSKRVSSLSAVSQDNKLRSTRENGTADIMCIVQGTNRKSLKQLAHKHSSSTLSKESENTAGLRLKKIMRRGGEDKDSSVLVQELRKEIREAVRNRSSKEVGQNLFDPKLLSAFRAALAGSVTETESKKLPLDLKAKKSQLQKGKVRESLTRKIYGINGRRRKAWTRDCEIEFWKHRCLKTTKPEKIQTLKSVLDLIRNGSDYTEKLPGNDGEGRGSILSRLYLADASVMPRKCDIEPVSSLKSIAAPALKKENGLAKKSSTSSPRAHSCMNPPKKDALSQGKIPILDTKGTKKSAMSTKGETASGKVHQNKCSGGSSKSTFGGMKVPSEKEAVGKSDDMKCDKRKWALELLARKTAVLSKNAAQENEEDNSMVKVNYPLLAQLPKDMWPVFAPSRHDKIPVSIRQAQLYRLTEHFLTKANISVIRRTAETELAVADAVTIEKGIADKSNSKLVYMNLCSQELLRRSDNASSSKTSESNPSVSSEFPSDGPVEETIICSMDLEVNEALKTAGLMSDSPPNSPIHQSLFEEDEGPDNVFEVDSHPELDIYGDFEYNLEENDFIGAGALKISKSQTEESKIKVVFSTLNPEKSIGTMAPLDHEGLTNDEASNCSSCLPSSQTSLGGSTVVSGTVNCLEQNILIDGDEEPSPDECEELYGPDKEPLIQKYPETVAVKPYKHMMNHEFHGENGDHEDNQMEKEPEPGSASCVDNLEVSNVPHDPSVLKESPHQSRARENAAKKKKISKTDVEKQSESNSIVSKKVESYIKEHIRPLCKSGVITVEEYRWAVGKTTEKVMKYHSKDKNANFLVKEGEKVKKLAEQYVEAAQQKAKN
ncbi:uncharacterized protein Fot_09142 [Forsythia ovata]|uniref:RING/U-box protein n=1 Tax=Forsythia ovata TaxID=205694 RepID=A0ABD1WDE7_9LAMI